MSVTISELTIADEPGAWAALGFTVDREACRVGDRSAGLAVPVACMSA